MAQATLGNVQGVVDKRQTQGSTTQKLTSPANYADVAAMRAALKLAQAGTYTDAYIDKMTYNDCVYALRTLQDSAGIK